MRHPKHSYLVALALLLTTGYLVGIATNILPGLRGPEAWRWARAIPGNWGRLWLPALLLVVYIALIQASQWLPRARRQLAAIGLAMIAVPALQFALLYMDHPDIRSQLFYRTVSPAAGGFFNVGASAPPPAQFLAEYGERMASYPVHPQRHPPGLPLLFLLTRRGLENQPNLAQGISQALRPYQCHDLSLMSLDNAALASAVLQMTLPLWLALIIPGLHRLVRLHYDVATANIAVLVYPLIPSVGLWATRWNQLYGLFTIVCLLLLHRGLSRRQPIFFLAAGLTISLASFFSFGNLALVGFAGVYGLIWLWRAEQLRPEPWLLVSLLAAAIGLTAVWLIVAFWGVNFLALMQISMSFHYGLARDYWLWLGYHLVDFFIFLGLPLATLWFYRLGRRLRRPSRRRDLLLTAFALGLLLLDLSGTSQGEVARVWAFLLPLAVATAVKPIKENSWLQFLCLSLMAGQLFVSNIYLRPVGTGLTDPPAPPPPVAVANSVPVASWPAGPRLEAAAVHDLGRNRLRLDTIWNSSQPIDHPYTIFVHVLDETGALVGQADGQPLAGGWPTSCWQPGQAFADSYEIALPAGTPARDLQLRLGFYWLPTGERLPTTTPGQDSVSVP